MIYESMKTVITHENDAYKNGSKTGEEYKLWKADTEKKLKVFLKGNRLTQDQYDELIGMLIIL